MVWFFLSYVSALLIALGWLFWQHRKNNLSLPNHRSSHQLPTAQGGGIGIAVVGIVALWGLSDLNVLSSLWLVSPFVMAALAGWLDDFHELSGRIKLLLISFAVLPLSVDLPNSVVLSIFSNHFVLTFYLVAPILFTGMIWLVNLTNFMDGIDGLAVLQIVFMLVATWCFREKLSLSDETIRFVVYVGVACLAFLPFNFPKAQLFLGDTGSLFLGTLMAWLLVLFLTGHPNGLWGFLTLFAMFWVDATVTLVRRLLRGKSVFEAHREHAYQHLANELLSSHAKATLLIQLVNWLWLLPMSYVVLYAEWQFLWFVVALVPVIIYVTAFRAGQPWLTV